MKALPVTVLLTCLIRIPTWGASLEGNSSPCPLPPAGPVQNVLFTGSQNCPFALVMAQTLLDVTQTFQKGPPVTLVIGDKARNASFDTGHIIRIPQRLVFADKEGDDFQAEDRQLLTVVVHEYGHAILKEVWKKEFADTFGEMFADLEDLSNNAERNLTEKISSRGMRKRSEEIASQPAYRLYFLTLPAYSELYADALAVYYFNDPSVMYKALYFPSMPADKARLVVPRDFARQHSLEDLTSAKDEHTKLSLVRSFLGAGYQALSNEEKRTRLDKLEKAITRSIHIDLQRKTAPDIAEMNQRLIRFLQEP